jgi:DNA-binding NarL/FixJ family response regulator
MEVLRLIVRGLTDAAIAEELYISITTVRTHIRELLKKSGYSNRVRLACDVINKDLIVEGF